MIAAAMSESAQITAFSGKDDRFHPVTGSDRFLTETVWWNFYIPEHNLDAEIYLAFRPNLGVAYAGIYMWDEFCDHFTDTRYFDTRSYLPLPSSDLDELKLDNGFAMRVLEPLQRYELVYQGYAGASFQLEFTALAPPLGFLSVSEDPDKAGYAPGHFDQVGRMRGVLALDGERMEVDCLTQRDRSWGAVRKEEPGYPPDVDWHSAHFDDLWFQCWLWHEEPVSRSLQSGVVYKSGRPVPLVAVERRTQLDATGVQARSIELRIKDAEGTDYLLEGNVRNMFPWPGWFNMVGFAGLVEWRLDGRTGWGEVHDGRTVAGTIARKHARRTRTSGQC